MFEVFWVFFGVVLGGGFWPQVSIVCVCARVAWRIWCILEVVKWLSFCSLGFLFLVCVRAALLSSCPFYNPVGVVLLSFCVWARCIPCGRSLDFVLCRYSLLPKVAICNGFPL